MRDVLNEMYSHVDSEPFREPVDGHLVSLGGVTITSENVFCCGYAVT